jgi:hypothetical protein
MDYQPRPNDIIIGRGQYVKMHPGNRRFQQRLQDIAVTEYATAKGKNERTALLNQLLAQLRQDFPDTLFIKRHAATKRYRICEEALARATAAQGIRDFLHGSYRSSRKFKQEQRGKQNNTSRMMPPKPQSQQEQQQEKQATVASSASATAPTNGRHHGAARRAAAPPAPAPAWNNDTGPRTVSPEQDMDLDQVLESSIQQLHDEACFDILMTVFAPSSVTTEDDDPFEPRPLVPSSTLHPQQQQKSTNTAAACF